MAREYCLFVLEGGNGTPAPFCNPVAPAATANIWTTAATTGIPSTASGADNYSAFYARLDGGDSFTMRPRPVPVTVPYGGGFAIPAFTVSDKQVLEGTYKTKLYAGAFTEMLLKLACQQVNAGGYVGANGVAAGWQYGVAAGSAGSQAGNLPSVSIFHAIQLNGTYKHRLYRGVRVKSWNFTISENSTIGDLTLQLTAAYASGNSWAYGNSVDPTAIAYDGSLHVPTFGTTTTPSTWCAPTTACLPVTPWLFLNTSSTGGTGGSGYVKIGASALTARTYFQSLSMSCTNQLMTRFWANRFVQMSQFVGRNLTVSLQSWYDGAVDDRTEYEKLDSQQAEIKLGDGTHSITFAMNANNIITSIEDQLPLADIYTQNMTLTSQFDPAYSQTDANLAADFELSFTE